jgi:hypothetical protein
VTLRHHAMKVRGRVHDTGCKSANLIPGTGHVKHVNISIAKIRGDGTGKNCRWLRRGRLTSYRSCTHPISVRAHGKRKWHITYVFPTSLPKGQYLIFASAVDRSGNRERPPKRFHLTYK